MLNVARITLVRLATTALLLGVGTACGEASPPATTPLRFSPSPSGATSAPDASSSSGAAPATSSSTSGETERPAKPPVVGGPCAYDDQAGTCTVDANKTFTFKGNIGGTAVILKGNELFGTESTAAGTSVPCSIRFITKGTCTPCGFSIGSCGEEAWNAFRTHGKR